MTEDQRRRDTGDPFREGVRAITGILGALKDAIEETFDDLRQQGDLSPEKAREAARSTMRRAQDAVDDVRDRLDLVSRREFDALREEVADLKIRVDAMAGPAAASGTTASTASTDENQGSGSQTGGGANGPEGPAAAGGPGFPVDGA